MESVEWRSACWSPGGTRLYSCFSAHTARLPARSFSLPHTQTCNPLLYLFIPYPIIRYIPYLILYRNKKELVVYTLYFSVCDILCYSSLTTELLDSLSFTHENLNDFISLCYPPPSPHPAHTHSDLAAHSFPLPPSIWSYMKRIYPVLFRALLPASLSRPLLSSILLLWLRSLL